MLSHHSAARVHGLRVEQPSQVALTIVGGDRGRSRRGLAVHRCAALDRSDRAWVAGMPVTSIVLTVIDVSADLSNRGTEHLLDQALRRVTVGAFARALERHPRRAGTAGLRRLLDPERSSSDTWSWPEERLLRLLRRAGLPSSEANVPIDRFFPDLLFRPQRVIDEYDSYDFHSGPGAFHSGHERHNSFTAQGYTVLHVTRRQLRHHPEQVLALIAATLTRGGGW
jgi:very-short-patch-repair endonuclease